MPQRRTWLLRTRASVSLVACAEGAGSTLATATYMATMTAVFKLTPRGP
jgi:hypothetical protein